jgi:GNAT superfamily N-acetyltransferase
MTTLAGTGTAGYTITRHDPLQDTDDEIAERVAFSNLMTQEVLPDDPPATVEQAIAAIRSSPERIRRISFRARDAGGVLVGAAGTNIDPEDDNPDVLFAGLNLLPDHRRQGLGTRLLAELVRFAIAEGKTRLIAHTVEGRPGPEFAEAVGATTKQANHMNHLPLAEVDRPMLERWVAEAADRAPEYELIAWDGPVPEEYMAKWLDLVLVMNTAPRDAQDIRDSEKVMAAVGYENWVLVAQHRATGEWAGFHDVSHNPTEPQFAYVGATGVVPEHRGHALGKWLKAAMTLRVLDEKPDVTNIRTGNADSNDAMLGINKEMGYRPLIGQSAWELPVETAVAWLEARGALLD